MEVAIGPGEVGDAGRLNALHHRAALLAFADIFPADAPLPDVVEDRARWARWLDPDADPDRRSYVARTEAGTIVGVALTGPDDGDTDVGHLSRFYVEPDHWGCGIGTALHRAAIEDLGSRFPAATLWVLEGNVRARSWYERLGWRLTPNRLTTYAPPGSTTCSTGSSSATVVLARQRFAPGTGAAGRHDHLPGHRRRARWTARPGAPTLRRCAWKLQGDSGSTSKRTARSGSGGVSPTGSGRAGRPEGRRSGRSSWTSTTWDR